MPSGDSLSPVPIFAGKKVSEGSNTWVANESEARSHKRSSNSSIPCADDACKYVCTKSADRCVGRGGDGTGGVIMFYLIFPLVVPGHVFPDGGRMHVCFGRVYPTKAYHSD